jgi:hypothetical protein
MSALDGSVSNNTVTTDGDHRESWSKNIIDDGSFEGSAGINVVGQSTGHNSLIQQNVTVQSNIDLQ